MNKTTITIILSLLAMLTACANRGIGPQGGPKDETPPQIVSETPQNGTLNYHDKVITLNFDEYVQLDNVSENVLISPPQQKAPEVKAIGKRVTVRFDEDLQDSTTYTINFGSAIVDNNEKNPLENYTFSFSTGDVIDSLEISGILLNAEDLNFVSKVIVGVHANHADSALETIPFTRIGKSDAEGKFIIKNLRHGDYRLYALNDVSKDYIYQPGEGLAIYDSLVTPYAERHIASDTLWRDSISTRMIEGERHRDTTIVIDTIITKERTFYHPDSLILLYFNEDKSKQYFLRALREKQHIITLLFSAPQDSLPEIQPIDSTDWTEHILIQPSLKNDTITLWLRDSSVISNDTLLFTMTYMKTDSLYQLQPQTDTIRAVYRAPKLSAAAKAKLEKDKQKQQYLEIKNNIGKSFDIYAPLEFRFPTPIDSVNPKGLKMFEMHDTLPVPIKTTIEKADSIGMLYSVTYPWKAEMTYKYELDSAAFKDIYGLVNNLKKAQFTIKSLDEYSTLTVKLEPFLENAVIQILSDKDQVIREMPAKKEGTKFEYLKPESLYLRLFVDFNGDSKWTTGDLKQKRQPEPVYYFPQKLTLRANWDFEETWNPLSLPLDKQKPKELQKDANSKKK